MLWVLVLILLIAVFGIGAVLKAAFWVLVIIAAAVVATGLLLSRALR